MSSIELVAGGARGGKSSYALNRAQQTDKNLVFIATAEAGDGSMKERIERHKAERSERWGLIEEHYDLATIVENATENDCILIDCLTLWLSNWLCLEDSSGWVEQKRAFLTSLENTSANVILVTNEVGMGIVPVGELSRQFVDESGWLHQAIAGIADEVVLVMFGIPQKLKSSSV